MEVLSDELVKLKKKIEPGHMLDTLIVEHEKIKEFLTELEALNVTIQKQKSYNENPDLFMHGRLFSPMIEVFLSSCFQMSDNLYYNQENLLYMLKE
ncbi:hypothetical protein CLORY_43110 [Clostridium oryzae]|uniref:Uncharacterized protein n=1 Tax=Clostridium oryzae TaxID=1450648 RepID=A0A1V4I850_9CLOT|nr:hypothetical protein CLORY_43110 [Clostridium oryzae]